MPKIEFLLNFLLVYFNPIRKESYYEIKVNLFCINPPPSPPPCGVDHKDNNNQMLGRAKHQSKDQFPAKFKNVDKCKILDYFGSQLDHSLQVNSSSTQGEK
jgi:hypothetical protein